MARGDVEVDSPEILDANRKSMIRDPQMLRVVVFLDFVQVTSWEYACSNKIFLGAPKVKIDL